MMRLTKAKTKQPKTTQKSNNNNNDNKNHEIKTTQTNKKRKRTDLDTNDKGEFTIRGRIFPKIAISYVMTSRCPAASLYQKMC